MFHDQIETCKRLWERDSLPFCQGQDTGIIPASGGDWQRNRHRILGVRLLFVALLFGAATVSAQPQLIRVTASSLPVHEQGGTYTQNVWLSSQPTADVEVTLNVADTTVATVSISSLIFTPDNYDMPQSVTVTGVDDAVYNAPHRTTTVTLTAQGGNYEGVTHTVRVTAVNDDPGSVTVPEGSTFNLRLGLTLTQGQGTVVVTLSSSNTDVLTVSPRTLAWTEAESGTRKPFTFTAVDNDLVGDRSALLSFTPGANYPATP